MMLQRYGCVDTGVRPREVVLLRSLPCSWGKCTFCDYCEDNVDSVAVAAHENAKVLQQVTGKHGVLQVIDSASWSELPFRTVQNIIHVCKTQNIKHVIFEGHWMFENDVQLTSDLFSQHGIKTEYIIGLESIDPKRREKLNKGIPSSLSLDKIRAAGFNWCNLMYGDSTSPGVLEFMAEVAEVSSIFDYVNVSIFTNNPVAKNHGITRNAGLVDVFYDYALPTIKSFENVFVFDFEDERAPNNLGGAGDIIISLKRGEDCGKR